MGRRSMREAIIEAAVEQFHTYGFNGAGVKDITDAAGVPKGSFYNHFDSKESLAVVALRRFGDSRRLHTLTEPGADPVARLREHFEFLRAEHVGFGYARGCLVGAFGTEIADHSDVIREAVEASLRAWADAITTAIGRAQEAGQVDRTLDPGATARFLLNAWEGTLISARTHRTADAFEPFFRIAFGTLLR